MSDVLPLRTILYQLLFLVLAIAVESLVLQKYLGIGRKSSIQYAATANLLSTVFGWFVFFIVEPWLPPAWRQQLINYVFFDLTSTPPVLIGLAFITFLGTFIVKLQSLDWLDLILENKKPTEIQVRDRTKFQGRKAQRQSFAEIPNRALAVLWANAASFSAITLIIAIRTFSEPPASF
ncbi:MAG: hypothetical protein MUC48_15790 [Leptolyngbya sp. Prado105]|jgi:hypothetical protein|nr:hypothetical protein [Leptolyngbya sp. Prado105]